MALLGRSVTTFDPLNTTWFKDGLEDSGINSIADTDSGLFIRKADYSTPLLALELTRSSLKFNPYLARDNKTNQVKKIAAPSPSL